MSAAAAQPTTETPQERLTRLIHEANNLAVEIEAKAAALKSVKSTLAREYEPAMKALLNVQGKEHGERTLKLYDVPLKGEITRKVKWDSNMLKAWCLDGTIPPDMMSQISSTLTISEKSWTEIQAAAPQLATKLLEARTVEYSPFSVKL